MKRTEKIVVQAGEQHPLAFLIVDVSGENMGIAGSKVDENLGVEGDVGERPGSQSLQ